MWRGHFGPHGLLYLLGSNPNRIQLHFQLCKPSGAYIFHSGDARDSCFWVGNASPFLIGNRLITTVLSKFRISLSVECASAAITPYFLHYSDHKASPVFPCIASYKTFHGSIRFQFTGIDGYRLSFEQLLIARKFWH